MCVADTDASMPLDAAMPDGGVPLPDDVHVLDGIGSEGSREAYSALDRVVGDAEIIGLGTPVYTSGGADRLAQRVVRHLVEELGFRALAMHAPWAPWQDIEASMCTAGAEAAVVDDPWGIWASEETAATLDWICEWNAAHPDRRVRVMGFDHQDAYGDAQALEALIAEHASAEQAPTLLDPVHACVGTTEPASVFYSRLPIAMTREAHDACNAGLDALSSWLDGLATTLDADALAVAHIRITALRQVELAFWHATAELATGNEPDPVLWSEAYGLGLARTLLAQRARLAPEARTVVMAHVAHVLEDPEAFGNGEARSMGAFLGEPGGARYRGIGITAASITANWPGRDVGTHDLAAPGSLEAELRALGVTQALIDLHPERSARRLLDEGERAGLLGAADTSPAAGLHGLIYLEASAAMTSLRW